MTRPQDVSRSLPYETLQKNHKKLDRICMDDGYGSLPVKRQFPRRPNDAERYTCTYRYAYYEDVTDERIILIRNKKMPFILRIIASHMATLCPAPKPQ